MIFPAPLLAWIATFWTSPITGIQPVRGGCIHQAVRVETEMGPFFLKYNSAYCLANLLAEAEGLAALRHTGKVRVPAVLQVGLAGSFSALALEWIDSAAPRPSDWRLLGRQMAALHQVSAPAFGWKTDNFIGALPQKNTCDENWAAFFVANRILPLALEARAKGLLDREDLRLAERLPTRLSSCFPDEPPALIHGDLWRGNLLFATGQGPVLIDPAVHFAHREMEIAFMNLFDCPPDAFYEGYDSQYPLQKDWKSRTDLCNLYPLLTHTLLFGGGYAARVRASLRRWA